MGPIGVCLALRNLSCCDAGIRWRTRFCVPNSGFTKHSCSRTCAFHARVWAPDLPLARLLASVLAESSFADGSYQLVDAESMGSQLDDLRCDEPEVRVAAERPVLGNAVAKGLYP